ncbi:tereporin-Ca1-like isoform X1 [Mytilus edulis]|uniref:tereporin-Ca1-like isoform X1 n=1 Tax=Mytilus edulis TaxID=6550 RepID=UPI0039F0F904
MAHQSRRHRRFAKAEDDSQNNDSNDDVSVHSSQEDDTESNGRNIDANIRNYTRNQSTSSRVTWNGHMLTSMGDSTRLGSSLQGTNLSTMMTNKHYRTVVGIEIANWTKYHLTSPEVNIYSGYISMPPVSVRPGQKEGMIAHKHGYTMTGSSGIVSWLIEKREKRVVIVWGSPFIASNTMAVGLTTAGKDNHESSWFNTITQGKSDANLRYEPFTYDNAIKEIIIEDKDFQICGSMGTSHKPEVKITVRPTKRMDLSIDGLQ